MERTSRNRDHNYYQELLEAYVLGALTESEIEELEQHLDTCTSCFDEVLQLRATTLQLSLIVDEMEPPAQLRAKIYEAALREPRRPQETLPAPEPPVITMPPRDIGTARSRWLPWAMAAALLIVAVGLLAWNLQLRQEGASDDVRRIALVDPTTSSELGQVRYLEDQGVIVIEPEQLAPLAAGQVYEIWLIRGDVPQPAGVFIDIASRHAVAAELQEISAIAITIEPGPLGSPLPTSDPIAVAPVTDDSG